MQVAITRGDFPTEIWITTTIGDRVVKRCFSKTYHNEKAIEVTTELLNSIIEEEIEKCK